MVKLSWCVKNKGGLRFTEKNDSLGRGYLEMAKDFLGTMSREKDENLRASVSAAYYSIYYSIYAIMQKIGVKCEIHKCSIEFAKKFLGNFYFKEDFDFVERAFFARQNLQYYVDKKVNKEDINLVLGKAHDFFILSRDIFAKLKDSDIEKIREELKGVIK